MQIRHSNLYQIKPTVYLLLNGRLKYMLQSASI